MGEAATTAPRWLRVAEWAARVAAAAAGIALLAMCLNVVADVTMRNLANRSLPGTLDYVAYLWMPAAALLGLGLAQLGDEQIRVTLLVDQAAHDTRRWTLIAGDALTAVIVAWMVWLSFVSMTDAVRIQESSTLGNPVWPARIVVFVAFVVFEISILARIAGLVQDRLPSSDIDALMSGEGDDVAH